jgi:hypothetical protein
LGHKKSPFSAETFISGAIILKPKEEMLSLKTSQEGDLLFGQKSEEASC